MSEKLCKVMLSFSDIKFLAEGDSNKIIDPQDIINKLFPNGWQGLVIQLLAFGVMIAVVIFLGYKPVKKLLEKRAEYVQNHIHKAEEANVEANRKLAEANRHLLDSRIEARKIVLEAKEEAETERQTTLRETKIEIRNARIQAEKDRQQEQLKAQEDVHKEIVNIALTASSRVLQREVSITDNEELIRNFIEELK